MADRRTPGREKKRDRRHPFRATPRLGVASEAPPPEPADPAHSAQRERLTVKLPREVIDRLRDAVFYTEGITMTSVIEDSVLEHIARLESERGAAFPRRLSDLRPGRPRVHK